jgi:hypothetical protein
MHRGFVPHDIVRSVSAHTIQQEHQFGASTITDFAYLCREAMLDYMLGCSQKTAGPKQTVESDERVTQHAQHTRTHT